MKRGLLSLALAAILVLSCSDDDGEQQRSEDYSKFVILSLGVFPIFCGAPTEYAAGTHSIISPAGVYTWITFPGDFSSLYELQVSETAGQNVLIETIDCFRSTPGGSLENTTATGQTESFFESPPSSSQGLIILCSEGCDNAITLTIPASPAPPM